MSESDRDWERWRNEWTSEAVPPLVAGAARAAVAGEQRRIDRVRLIEAALATVAVGGVAATLLHTAATEDIAMAAVVIAALVVVAAVELTGRREAATPTGESTDAFLALSIRRCRRQLRAVRFTWVLLALAAVFFVPWWTSGFRVHPDALTSPLSLATSWLPLVTMLATLGWSLRVRHRVQRELVRLDTLVARFRDA
jgi:hypothetical protein